MKLQEVSKASGVQEIEPVNTAWGENRKQFHNGTRVCPVSNCQRSLLLLKHWQNSQTYLK